MIDPKMLCDILLVGIRMICCILPNIGRHLRG